MSTVAESIAAHDHVQPTKKDTWARILAYGRWCGLRGFTTDQLATDWGCDHDHVAPRVTELFKAGELILTKERRPTRSGCRARVYIVKQKAPAPVIRPSQLFPVSERHRDNG